MNSSTHIDGKPIKVKDAFFTWSNLISFTRVLVGFPIIYLHYHNGQQADALIIGLVFYGVFSDYLDGLVARSFDEVSELGKILDPVADKLTAALLFVYAVYIDRIPLWFLMVEIGRDALILGGSLIIYRLYGKVAMAVMSGKVSVNALSAYWISAFFFPGAVGIQHFFMGASIALMLYSFFDYLHRFNEIRKGATFN